VTDYRQPRTSTVGLGDNDTLTVDSRRDGGWGASSDGLTLIGLDDPGGRLIGALSSPETGALELSRADWMLCAPVLRAGGVTKSCC
jgi:hypothetical protein